VKVSEIAKALSAESRKALEATASSRVGANVTETGRCGAVAATQLRKLGVIGIRGGLTVKGSAVAQKVQRELEDRMFA
jgi:hypothetical protein